MPSIQKQDPVGVTLTYYENEASRALVWFRIRFGAFESVLFLFGSHEDKNEIGQRVPESEWAAPELTSGYAKTEAMISPSSEVQCATEATRFRLLLLAKP
ncbi:hypothetical protein AVEN_82378-1 [Araneus ventricosus]|uniref:Uncharacterized protein n=1 Tax=Araneus ventricosus TaxID=182803 RepID=A0A4Y2HIN9_ARAVE|nr:hypothetical protein AVEN_82378-1 [Araneus ventricosus]